MEIYNLFQLKSCVYYLGPKRDPMKIRNEKNPSPHFIFISYNDEKKFYIAACDRLINVRLVYSFLHVYFCLCNEWTVRMKN